MLLDKYLPKYTYKEYHDIHISCSFENYIPQHDSEIVQRYKKAGLIVVGKTNLCEFGSLPVTESKLFGACHNPWDLSKNAGGSSGGSAAVVASGIVPMASGSDGGGSIRIPASCCGVFGLKPTRARTPVGPDMSEILLGWVIQHAVTRSVRDSARLLDISAGNEVGAPYAAPYQKRPYSEEIIQTPQKLRIAYSNESINDDVPVHSDCKAALQDAVQLCMESGHDLIEVSPKYDGRFLIDASKVLFFTEVACILESGKFAHWCTVYWAFW